MRTLGFCDRPDNRLLRRLGALARRRGTRAFLVGGPVRDLLLGHRSPDIDIAVEKDSHGFGRAVARELGGRFVYHARFLTGTITFAGTRSRPPSPFPPPQGGGNEREGVGPGHVDVTQTRTETYSRPAALPKVKPATIEQDLARRDFAINAMALELTPRVFGRLMDPHHGQDDLRLRVVRVLHPASFIDDPTRAFRAIRFAVRLGFEIEPRTLGLMRDSIGQGCPGLLTPERILYELRLICAEPKALQVFEAILKEKLLQSCFPSSPKSGVSGPGFLAGLLRVSRVGASDSEERAIRWHTSGSRCRNRRRETAPTAPRHQQHAGPDLVYLYVLSRLPLTDRFPITRLERDSLQALRAFPNVRGRLLRAERPSTVYRLLGRFPVPALELLRRLESAPVCRRLAGFLDNLSKVRTSTTGKDLVRLGLTPGPAYRRILDQLLCARLDGTVSSDAEEARLARTLARRTLSRQSGNPSDSEERAIRWHKSRVQNRRSSHV